MTLRQLPPTSPSIVLSTVSWRVVDSCRVRRKFRSPGRWWIIERWRRFQLISAILVRPFNPSDTVSAVLLTFSTLDQTSTSSSSRQETCRRPSSSTHLRTVVAQHHHRGRSLHRVDPPRSLHFAPTGLGRATRVGVVGPNPHPNRTRSIRRPNSIWNHHPPKSRGIAHSEHSHCPVSDVIGHAPEEHRPSPPHPQRPRKRRPHPSHPT